MNPKKAKTLASGLIWGFIYGLYRKNGKQHGKRYNGIYRGYIRDEIGTQHEHLLVHVSVLLHFKGLDTPIINMIAIMIIVIITIILIILMIMYRDSFLLNPTPYTRSLPLVQTTLTQVTSTGSLADPRTSQGPNLGFYRI